MPISQQLPYSLHPVQETTANIRTQNTINTINALSAYSDWASLNDLQADLNLSRPTLNSVLSSLEKTGLVQSTTAKVGHALGGRKPQLFKMNPHHHNTLVMRVNLSGCTGKVISAAGSTIYQHFLPHSDLESTDKTFIALTKELLSKTTGPVYATTIALMGIVCDGELIRSDSFPALTNKDWVKAIQSLLTDQGHHSDVKIVNDAKVATQWMYNLLQQNQTEPETLVAIHCSDTVGAGLMFNGKLLEGARGAAGEILLGDNSDWRGCARRLNGLAQKYGCPANEIFSVEEICRQEADEIRSIGADIGRALIPIINLLDPEMIAIGGALSECGPLIEPAMAQVIDGNTSTPPEIFITPRGTQSVLSGCFLHAGQHALAKAIAAKG
ncbi:MAG: ROK family protein [Actinomycetaceae bacterium]|nr:ROK family protein [Actinomycetaceae bacterium]